MGNITPVSEVVAHSSIHRLEGTEKRADSYPEGFDQMAALPKSVCSIGGEYRLIL
jgi:hypothetical protein